MSDGMALGADLASKLRLDDGRERAQRALDVVRAGINHQPKMLRGLAAGAGSEHVVIRHGQSGRIGGVRSPESPPPSNSDKIGQPGRSAQEFSNGLVNNSGPRLRKGAGATWSVAPPREVSGGAAARPASNVEVGSGPPRAEVAIVPRYTVRARTLATPARAVALVKPEAGAAQFGERPDGGATGSGRGEKSFADEADWRRSEGAVGLGAQNAAPVNANARAAVMAIAPTAPSPMRRSKVTTQSDFGLQSGGSAATDGAAERSDAGASTPADAHQMASSGPVGGDVYLDGALMGRWMARNLANQAARPASGGAGFDPRRGVFPTGAMIGG